MESALHQEATWPPPGPILTSAPWSCRSYCFRPPSLWWFVTATLENNTLSCGLYSLGKTQCRLEMLIASHIQASPAQGPLRWEVGGRPLFLWKLSRHIWTRSGVWEEPSAAPVRLQMETGGRNGKTKGHCDGQVFGDIKDPANSCSQEGRRSPEEKLMDADLSEEGGPLIKGKERVWWRHGWRKLMPEKT